MVFVYRSSEAPLMLSSDHTTAALITGAVCVIGRKNGRIGRFARLKFPGSGRRSGLDVLNSARRVRMSDSVICDRDIGMRSLRSGIRDFKLEISNIIENRTERGTSDEAVKRWPQSAIDQAAFLAFC